MRLINGFWFWVHSLSLSLNRARAGFALYIRLQMNRTGKKKRKKRNMYRITYVIKGNRQFDSPSQILCGQCLISNYPYGYSTNANYSLQPAFSLGYQPKKFLTWQKKFH